MRKAITILLIISAICANTIPRWIGGISGDVFCFWVAFSFVLLTAAARLKPDNKIINYLFEFVIIVAANDTLDEYFRIAESVNDYEVLFGVLSVSWLAYRVINLYEEKILQVVIVIKRHVKSFLKYLISLKPIIKNVTKRN